MNKLVTVVCLMMLVVLISCGGSSRKDSFDESLAVADSLKAKPVADTTPAMLVQPSPPASQNITVPGNVNVTPATPQKIEIKPVAGAANPGMNPPHGQPGHRCDIAVGAPLNSAPKTVTTQVQPAITANATSSPTSTNPITITPASTTPVKTAPGMNPPHGQPGHRCDIAVGAPLNSVPKAATPSITIKQDTGTKN